MPSNFTENYQLSQWEPGDQVLREDFNADNAKIDAAVAAALSAALTGSPCVMGAYTGTGEAGTLELGFRPSVFMAWASPKVDTAHSFDIVGAISIDGGSTLYFMRGQNSVSASPLSFQDYGMELGTAWPNVKSAKYSYLAIR